MSQYDLEKIIMDHKRSGNRNLPKEVVMLIKLYDKKDCKKLTYQDFNAFFTPKG